MKTEVIRCYTDEATKKKIVDAAKKQKLSVSSYLVQAALQELKVDQRIKEAVKYAIVRHIVEELQNEIAERRKQNENENVKITMNNDAF